MHQPGIEQRPLQDDQRHHHRVRPGGLRRRARRRRTNMIGEPGEGWRLAMTIVSHEREPAELGFASRYSKTVQELEDDRRGGSGGGVGRPAPSSSRGRTCRPRCCASTCAGACRSVSTASVHGSGGSIDKLLMTWVEQTVGHAALSFGARRARSPVATTRPARHLPLQPRPERDGRHVADPEEHHRHADPRSAGRLTTAPIADDSSEDTIEGTAMYDVPDEIVGRDRRPDAHRAAEPAGRTQRRQPRPARGLSPICSRRSAGDRDARAVVITGNGRAFSAGGDFNYSTS